MTRTSNWASYRSMSIENPTPPRRLKRDRFEIRTVHVRNVSIHIRMNCHQRHQCVWTLSLWQLRVKLFFIIPSIIENRTLATLSDVSSLRNVVSRRKKNENSCFCEQREKRVIVRIFVEREAMRSVVVVGNPHSKCVIETMKGSVEQMNAVSVYESVSFEFETTPTQRVAEFFTRTQGVHFWRSRNRCEIRFPERCLSMPNDKLRPHVHSQLSLQSLQRISCLTDCFESWKQESDCASVGSSRRPGVCLAITTFCVKLGQRRTGLWMTNQTSFRGSSIGRKSWSGGRGRKASYNDFLTWGEWTSDQSEAKSQWEEAPEVNFPSPRLWLMLSTYYNELTGDESKFGSRSCSHVFGHLPASLCNLVVSIAKYWETNLNMIFFLVRCSR